jgi:hypothetical protein
VGVGQTKVVGPDAVARAFTCRLLDVLQGMSGAKPDETLPQCWTAVPADFQAPFWHFFMKLFFAAPKSGLPSLPTALIWHASFLHFLTKLVFAAPASGLPSLPIAWLSQAVWAIADPMVNDMTKAARNSRFTLFAPFLIHSWSSQSDDEAHDSQQQQQITISTNAT